MNNKELLNLEIPENIDSAIDTGIEKAYKEIKYKQLKRLKISVGITAASLVLFFTFGFTNPALASKLPIVGSVFENIEKNVHFPGNYSQYSTSINKTVTDNGINVTLSDILCDGESLYVTYVVESEKPFKYTTGGPTGDGPLTRTQILTQEAYTKVSFSKNELENTGIAGLQGKFIDENTFIGMHRYYLNSLNAEIPDNFDFQIKLTSFGTKDYKENGNTEKIDGTWAFKVPVKVDKSISKNLDVNFKENNDYSLDSVLITPFSTSIYTSSPDDTAYIVKIIDDKNNELTIDGGKKLEDNKMITYFSSNNINDSKTLRVIIYKNISDYDYTVPNSVYVDLGDDILLDKTVNLE